MRTFQPPIGPRLAKALHCLYGLGCLLFAPTIARAGILGFTPYSVDFTLAGEAKKATWSDATLVGVQTDGLGWGHGGNEGSRDFWLQTSEPIGIGTSWRPASAVHIKATIDQSALPGMLYARYSADGRHWSSWQLIPAAVAKPGQTAFAGEMRVPYRDQAAYNELRMEYNRRQDVAWSSDEEALAKELVARDPNFFAKEKPFIGYVQFLYESQLHSGQRIKKVSFELSWAVGGIHTPPKDQSAYKDRDGVWRLKVDAP
jgi:hypothetical protein